MNSTISLRERECPSRFLRISSGKSMRFCRMRGYTRSYARAMNFEIGSPFDFGIPFRSFKRVQACSAGVQRSRIDVKLVGTELETSGAQTAPLLPPDSMSQFLRLPREKSFLQPA